MMSTTIVTPTNSILRQSEVTRGLNTTFVVERSVFDNAVVRFETDRVGIRLVCLANESN